MRLGSTNRAADAALIAELGRRRARSSFDEEPVPELDCEALDFAAASQCFAEVRTLRRKDLFTPGMVSEFEGRQVPTVGGIGLFGSDRLARLAGRGLVIAVGTGPRDPRRRWHSTAAGDAARD